MSTTNDHNHTPANERPDAEPIVALPGEERDVLISRVVDGMASAQDWASFRAVAASDPSIWAELGDTQRQQEAVRDELHSALAFADRVALPGGMIDDAPVRHRLDMVSRWGGWAAAIALMVVWLVGAPAGQTGPADPSGPQTGNVLGGIIPLSEAPPEQAFDRYMAAGQQEGRVIAEMPDQVVIETKPMNDGTIEVLYLRQIIERRVIDQAYRELRDDAGNVYAVPVRAQPRRSVAF